MSANHVHLLSFVVLFSSPDKSSSQVDYGYFNQFMGREVDQEFWGTRTEHIISVAFSLAIFDHLSHFIFSYFLGRELCFAKSPAPFIAHTFFFIAIGVSAFCWVDAAFSPLVSLCFI